MLNADNIFEIKQNLAKMQSSGDEMELYVAVTRRFREIFAEQEHMKSFKIYDFVEVGHFSHSRLI